MKNPNASAQTKLATELGTEPFIIVEVDWGTSIGQYADKDFAPAEGRIIEVDGLAASAKADQIGRAEEVSIVLDDTDGALKTILDGADIHRRPVSIYQGYGNLAYTDKFLLLKGKIQTPITWDEGTQRLSFNVGSDLEEDEIGFSVEEDEFDWIADEAVGEAWPLCFGKVNRVPALKVQTVQRGRVLNRYQSISKGDLNQLCILAESYEQANIDYETQFAIESTTDDVIQGLVESMTSKYINLARHFEELLALSNVNESDLNEYKVLCVELYRLADNIRIANATIVAETAKSEAKEAQIDQLYMDLVTFKTLVEADSDTYASLVATTEDQLEDAAGELLVITATLAAAEAALATYTSQQTLKTAQRSALEVSLTKLNVNIIVVDNGLEWPQGQVVDVVIRGMRLRGIFSGDIFVANQVELPFLRDVELAQRQNDNANEFWITNASDNLKGQFCLFKGGPTPHYKILYVHDQWGRRCFFEPIAWDISNVERPTYSIKFFAPGDGIIAETAPFVMSRWLELCDAHRTANNQWGIEIPEFVCGTDNLPSHAWEFEVGDTIFLSSDFSDLFVANLIPSTEINEVLAYRTIDQIKRLVPVPQRYYDKYLNYSIAGQNATVIIFPRPLDDYVGERWDATRIYVTLESTEGPNTADILEYLTNQYTNLTPDSSTFATVSSLLTNYPSHFALLNRQNALQTLEEIAWQARCTVQVRDDVLYIKYLSTEPSSSKTITETLIDAKTLQLGYTPTDELITKFVAEWRRDYVEAKRKVVLRNNIPKYGLFEKTFDFYIYNIKDLVIKSATFWLFRYSNTWKLLRFRGFMPLVPLDAFDAVLLDFNTAYVANADVTAVIHQITYDSDSKEVEIEVWVPVRAGEMTQYVFAWPADADSDEEYPTSLDIYAGGGA